jgi:hypothetical protein
MPAANRISATSKWNESRSAEAASFPSPCRPPGSSFARPKLSTTSTGTRHRAGNTSSNLDAGVKITASDGESRVIGVGEVILVENTTGKGHLSQHVDGKIRHSVFVPID